MRILGILLSMVGAILVVPLLAVALSEKSFVVAVLALAAIAAVPLGGYLIHTSGRAI